MFIEFLRIMMFSKILIKVINNLLIVAFLYITTNKCKKTKLNIRFSVIISFYCFKLFLFFFLIFFNLNYLHFSISSFFSEFFLLYFEFIFPILYYIVFPLSTLFIFIYFLFSYCFSLFWYLKISYYLIKLVFWLMLGL